MRKNILIFIVVAAVLGVSFFLLGASKIHEKKPTLPGKKLREILSPALINKNEKLSAPQSEVVLDQRCLDFFSEIAKIDLGDLNFPIKLDILPNSNQCITAPEELTALVAEYTKACDLYINGKEKMDFVSTEEQNQKFGVCLLYTFLLRSGISAWKVKDQKLSEISDLRLLSEKLAFAFSKLFGEKQDPTELIEVANRILEVDPQIYAAAKAVLVGEVFNAMSAVEAKSDSVDWKKLEESYQRVLQYNRNDAELDEFGRLVRTKGYQPDLLKTEAENLIANEPSNFLGFYLLSYSEWKSGNKNQSFSALKKAMQLAPKNSELQENWDKIHQYGANPGSFKRKVTFGINFNSFLN